MRATKVGFGAHGGRENVFDANRLCWNGEHCAGLHLARTAHLQQLQQQQQGQISGPGLGKLSDVQADNLLVGGDVSQLLTADQCMA